MYMLYKNMFYKAPTSACVAVSLWGGKVRCSKLFGQKYWRLPNSVNLVMKLILVIVLDSFQTSKFYII